MKIGEASIRTHELLRKAPAPWQDASRSAIKNSGPEQGVLFFVFRGSVFDIDRFGSAKQADMAVAIETEATALFDRKFPLPARRPSASRAKAAGHKKP